MIRLAAIICVGLGLTHFAVADPPLLGLSGNLTFAYQIGGSLPAPGSLTVTNVAHGDMAWFASVNVPWASISPASGSLPDTFDRGISSPPSTVTVNPTGLAAGSYAGTITVTASSTYGVPNSPQSIPITLVVAPANLPILSVSPTALPFLATQTLQDGGAATISVTNLGPGVLSFSASLNPGVSWLSLTQGPNSINVRATGRELAPGSYSTTIVISAPGAQPPSVSVAVTLNVQGLTPPSFLVDTTPLTFIAVAGAANTAAQQVSIGNGGQAPLNWQVTASTSNGGGWLKVTPASGTNTGSVTISADPSMLNAGVYVGRVSLSAAGVLTSPSIPVTLTVTRPASIQTNTAALSFSAVQGSNPSSQSVSFQNGGDQTLTWKASATTNDGKGWLQVSPSSGSGTGQISVAVLSSALAAGTYSGQVVLTCDGSCIGKTIPVTLAILAPGPTISQAGVVNAASLMPGPVSAGSIVSVFGAGLGPSTGVVGQMDSQGILSKSLAGTTILADGIAAPLFYVSATQINFQIPYEVAGKSKTHLVIQPSGAQATELDVPLVAANLALFTADGTQPIVQNPDYSLNSAAKPANAGDIVVLYGTGQGPLNQAVATGAQAPATSPFSLPTLPIMLSINGEQANVPFAGEAPGLIGVLQINVQIPTDIPSGPATLTFQQNGASGAQKAVIYVKATPANASAAARK